MGQDKYDNLKVNDFRDSTLFAKINGANNIMIVYNVHVSIVE